MLATLLLLPMCSAGLDVPQGPGSFAPPVRLRAAAVAGEGDTVATADTYVKTESPGYAAPCWHDVDGDGKKDLAVGQFAGGKVMLYRGLGGTRLETGKWLEAGGKVAEIPGVW